jgi:hypothetical protein
MDKMLEKEILEQLHAVQKKQDMTLEAVHQIDMKSDRALLVSVETRTNLNMVKRDMNRLFENCPYRVTLKDHLDHHKEQAQARLGNWTKIGIIAGIFGGPIAVNYLLPVIQAIITNVFFNGGQTP